MGKKRHSKDRMFITMTEHKDEWGGKKDPTKAPIAKLPFYACSLSLLPFENPVCTKEGMVFDIVNVVPYIKKYKKNPVNGQPLKITDLIKLNFTKDEKGQYHDPVTMKVFTEYSVILAIATTGNVYSKETIDELNKQPKNWKDLLTALYKDEPFTIKDIIVLQDPADLRHRQVQEFDYIKNEIDVASLRDNSKDVNQFINQSSIGKKVLEEVKAKYEKEEVKEPEVSKKIKGDSEKNVSSDIITPAEFVKKKLESKKYVHERLTSGLVASSFTSTAVDIATDNSTRLMTPHEIRKIYHDIIKSRQTKGFVKMITNFGAMDLLIHCDFTPFTGENFIELCEKKYYNETKFHRFVKNFVLQGGDPTGTGTGGESIFGSPFDDEFHEKLQHDKVGVLSMANSGPRTNRSQFFFALRPTKFLNGKHTVFGEVISGHGVLEIVNKIEADQNERPTKEIKILDTIVLTNPYREVIKELMDKEKKVQEEEKKKIESEKKKDERWVTSKDTHLIIAPTKPMPKMTSSLTSGTDGLFAPEEGPKKVRKDFDFSNW